ncbi:MAG TPA: hypothetical protein VKR31_10330 [Rhizomicrobium sp.]|nr:hypothetical protein [Rhizomicrobium sp.]
MSLKAMINWCRANPRVRAEFMRLMGCDGETDPDFIQALNLLVQSRIRREAEVEPIDTGDVEPAPVVRDLLAGAKQ